MRSSTLGTEVTRTPLAELGRGSPRRAYGSARPPWPGSVEQGWEPAAAVRVVLAPGYGDAHRDVCRGSWMVPSKNRLEVPKQRARHYLELELDADLGEVVADRPRLLGAARLHPRRAPGRPGRPARRTGRRRPIVGGSPHLLPGRRSGRTGTGRTPAGAPLEGIGRHVRRDLARELTPNGPYGGSESSSTSAALSIARATARRTWMSSKGGTARFMVTRPEGVLRLTNRRPSSVRVVPVPRDLVERGVPGRTRGPARPCRHARDLLLVGPPSDELDPIRVRGSKPVGRRVPGRVPDQHE